MPILFGRRLVYAVYLVFMNLMILNILIAVVNEVYDKQHEIFGQEYWYNKARETLSLDWNDRVGTRPKEDDEEQRASGIRGFAHRIGDLFRSLFQPNRLLSRGIENVMPLPPPLNLFALLIVPFDLVTGEQCLPSLSRHGNDDSSSYDVWCGCAGKQLYATWSIGIFNFCVMWLVMIAILIIGFIALILEFSFGLFFVWPVAICVGVSQAGKRLYIRKSCKFLSESLSESLSDTTLKIVQGILAPFVVSVVVFLAFLLLMFFTALLVAPIVLTVPGLKLYRIYLSYQTKQEPDSNISNVQSPVLASGEGSGNSSGDIGAGDGNGSDSDGEEEKNAIPGNLVTMSPNRQKDADRLDRERQEEKELAAMLMNRAICELCSERHTSHPGRLRQAAQKDPRDKE